MINRKREYYSFLIPVVLYILSVIIYYSIILQRNFGVFTYLLDDPYIHLSLARNLASTGILGVNQGEFAFLTSSPLWTMIITIFNLLGIKSIQLPLLLNIIINLFILFLIDTKFKKLNIKMSSRIIINIFFIIIIPSIVLTFIGMEHSLHLLLSLLFLVSYKKRLNHINLKSDFIIGLLAGLLILVRYESFFLIFPLVILSLIQKKYQKALIIIIFAFIPVFIVGFYSIINGWYFFPTSLMLKGSQVENLDFYAIIKFLFYFPLKKLYLNSGLTSIISAFLILMYIQFINAGKRNSIEFHLTICIFFSILLHLVFAQLGWFYRYEAYLIGIGVFWIIVNFDIFKSIKLKLSYKVIVLLLLMLPIFGRSYESHSKIIIASNNIFSQQYQLAGFLSKFYESDNIAVHDIGIISYYSKCRIVDLWGLANKDIYQMKKYNSFVTKNIQGVLDKENVKIALIYTQWFQLERNFYKNWYLAGSWTIQNNVACGEPRINFFAKDSITYIKLVRNLRQYSVLLPSEIYQKINYIN